MATTTVTTRHNQDESRVEAVLESGETPGFSQYDVPEPGIYRFFHTEVDDEYSGQGIATRIAEGVMEIARQEGVKVMPTCSVIRKYMRENEDTHDLLAPGARLEADAPQT